MGMCRIEHMQMLLKNGQTRTLRKGGQNMGQSINLKSMQMVLLILSLTTISVCSTATEPELRSQQLFPIKLQAGVLLIYHGPSDSLTIEGPAVVDWKWDDGELYMTSGAGSVRVRPLRAFPHQPMTPEMIAQAQAHFTSVPFIEERLARIPNPTDEEWADAYTAWLNAKSSFIRQLQIAYRDDGRADRAAVAEELLARINAHELVVPGSAKLAPVPDPRSTGRDIWVAYKGVPPKSNGSPDMWVIMLRADYHDPVPLPSRISREAALNLHHAVYLATENRDKPTFIDLSTGLTIRPRNWR